MIAGNHFANEINVTIEEVERWIPNSCCIHILPPFYSSGDYGFAPNSILEIDKSFGTWYDLKILSAKYRIILDGIFNHVGIHSNVFPDPVEYNNKLNIEDSCFYVFPKSDTEHVLNLSSRGGSVFRRTFLLDNTEYSVWQTFSDVSIDINLNNEKVKNYIRDFIDLCIENNIFGIRLDAVAYYYKELGVTQLHHPKAKKYAREIADKIINNGIFVLAQLDSDCRGQAYYPSSMGYNIPVYDYAFTSYLLYTQLSGDAGQLAQYLLKTEKYSQKFLRTPRNHDGILLRPKLFDIETKKKLLQLCKLYNIPVRISNGTPYEINNSFPYLCKICSVTESESIARNHASIILTVFQRGISYLYFPELVGYIPELNVKTIDEKDPRGLNRAYIEKDYLNHAIYDSNNQQLIEILDFLASRFENIENKEEATKLINNSCLIFERKDAKISVVINFSHKKKYFLDNIISGGYKCIFSSNKKKKLLEPGDYAVIDFRGDANGFR